jgi:hypothetical protein
VPEDLLDGPDVDAHLDQQRSGGVPVVVQPGVPYAGGEMLIIAGRQAPEPLREGLAEAATAFDPATRLPRTVTPASTVLAAALASSARAPCTGPAAP